MFTKTVELTEPEFEMLFSFFKTEYVPAVNMPHPGKFMDINMLAMTGGRERTENEFAALFNKADLQLNRIIATYSPIFTILEILKK